MDLISAYDNHHKKVWPEVLQSLIETGILSAEIYRWQNRLFMILETKPEFTLEKKYRLDMGNKIVKEWEELMWKYQQSLPGVNDGSKWQRMDRIFKMNSKG